MGNPLRPTDYPKERNVIAAHSDAMMDLATLDAALDQARRSVKRLNEAAVVLHGDNAVQVGCPRLEWVEWPR